MQARKIINKSACTEEARQTCSLAFDEGWRLIGPYFGDDPSQVEAVRVTLAQAILSQASGQISDAGELRDGALASLGWLPGARLVARSAPPVALKKVA